MEVVNIFNKELKSILESKLPVSRYKMSLITKSAMKALKFYKHVVQSVEKFIAKCACDYKVPGLYVIDAIVRQSKHQYCDKDVFVPRFMRNVVTTFLYLSQCDSKDLPSLERVLRLWQQNGVFPTDLVEALLELVYEPSSSDKIIQASTIVAKLVNEWNCQRGKPEEKLETFMPGTEFFNGNTTPKNEGGLIDSITKLLTRFHADTGQDVTSEINQIEILHKKIVEQSALLAQGEMIDAETLSQLHQSMEELTKKAAKAAAVQQSKLAMLANDDKEHLSEAINDMEFVEQLQQMVDTLGQTRALQEELRQALEIKTKTVVAVPHDDNTIDHGLDHDHDIDNDHKDDHEIVDDETTLSIAVPHKDSDFRTELKVDNSGDAIAVDDCFLSSLKVTADGDVDLRLYDNSLIHNYDNHSSSNCGSVAHLSNEKLSRSSSSTSFSNNNSNHHHHHHHHHNHRKRSESETTKYLKRKRSHSKESRKQEKRSRNSRKRYMPAFRTNYVAIVSKTIFIGHLHKHVSETKLRSLCEEYGSIAEFNMIPPRGCAFVSFEKRKSAYKALEKMHRMKFEGRELKVAWAPNKGVKNDKDFRDSWIEQEGCTYITMQQFPVNRIHELTDGGAFLDDDSLTDELRETIEQFQLQKAEALAAATAVARGIAPTGSMDVVISVAAEVVPNKTIPMTVNNTVIIGNTTVSVENTTQDMNSQFFPQFSAPPPPIMPTIIPYPPPPIFIPSNVPPPPISIPELSSSSSLSSFPSAIGTPSLSSPSEEVLSNESYKWKPSNHSINNISTFDEHVVTTSIPFPSNSFPQPSIPSPFGRRRGPGPTPGYRSPAAMMIPPPRMTTSLPPYRPGSTRFPRHPPPGFPVIRSPNHRPPPPPPPPSSV